MMHHSQLEYLIAVQKLQGEEMGAQGNKLAEEMDVSTGYILKLTKAAEQKGYVRRGKARSVYITEAGIAAMQEYLLAAQAMERLLVLGGVPKQEIENDALRSVCAVKSTTREALVRASKRGFAVT